MEAKVMSLRKYTERTSKNIFTYFQDDTRKHVADGNRG